MISEVRTSLACRSTSDLFPPFFSVSREKRRSKRKVETREIRSNTRRNVESVAMKGKKNRYDSWCIAYSVFRIGETKMSLDAIIPGIQLRASFFLPPSKWLKESRCSSGNVFRGPTPRTAVNSRRVGNESETLPITVPKARENARAAMFTTLVCWPLRRAFISPSREENCKQ